MSPENVDYRKEHNEYWSRPETALVVSNDMLGEITDHIETTAGFGSVLDIGCGDGRLVQAFCSRGLDASGLDASDIAVGLAQKLCPGRFTQGFVKDLPYADRSVDIVTCVNCLEFLREEDILPALREIARVARRALYVRIGRPSSENDVWRRTLKDRDWWEKCCFEADLRRHPNWFQIVAYDEAADNAGDIVLLMEPLPVSVARKYPLAVLREERDLHMDMGREAGRRSDAHMMRYHEAARHVRPGDRVLDAACGLGYGANVIRHNSLCAHVHGVDASDYAVDYASVNYGENGKVTFGLGALPDCLADFEPGSFDFIASFETLEHLKHPAAFLAACKRLLSPGGRIMVSVPNDWTEEDGRDPNPYHFHVYDWPALLEQVSSYFLLEKAFCQTASRRKRNGAWIEYGKEWREVPLERVEAAESEWSLVLAMNDPVAARQPFTDRHHAVAEGEERVPNVIDFANQYANPWIVSALVSIGLRTENGELRAEMAKRIAATQTGADAAAALCIEGYQLLSDQQTTDRINTWNASIAPFIVRQDWNEASPIDVRWGISLLYVSALLKKKTGDLIGAADDLLRLLEIPFMVYSPLIATKVIEARFQLGLWMWAQGDADGGRKHFLAGVEAAQAALSASWREAFGSNENLPRFVTAELSEILDLATRCVAAAHYVLENPPAGRVALEALWNRGYELKRLKAAVATSEAAMDGWFRPELARLQSVVDDLLKVKSEWYEPQFLRLQAENERLATEFSNAEKARVEWYEPELARQQAERERLVSSLAELETLKSEWYEPQFLRLQAENERLAIELSSAEKARVEWYEPELARLRSNIEHAHFEKETQSLRNRVLIYAEQARQANKMAAARAAEIARLSDAVMAYEDMKKKWWDPQLELRAGRIAELEEQLRQLGGLS